MAHMDTKGPATIDDLYNVPKDGRKYELVDGEIQVSPGGFRHGRTSIQIGYLLKRFLEESPIGVVCGPDLGIVFPNGNLRSPDVTFVRNERFPRVRRPKSFWKPCPTLPSRCSLQATTCGMSPTRSVNSWNAESRWSGWSILRKKQSLFTVP